VKTGERVGFASLDKLFEVLRAIVAGATLRRHHTPMDEKAIGQPDTEV